MGIGTGVVAAAFALPIIVVVGILALIGLAIYLRHRERMMGWPASHSLPETPLAPASPAALESALTLIGVGLALLLGLLTLGIGVWLLAGLIVLFIGLVRFGLIALGLEPAGSLSVPAPILLRRGLYTAAIGLALLLGLGTLGLGVWILGGLIPGCIGLAQLAAVLLSRRGWTAR